ncbi:MULTISPECIES: hypothetical protein [unclassified Pseudomonas]|uniref:hypothetical protein n=1 Tax=unclassified Pseudomonas TaxID=196821 RepID=UPI001A9D57D0|nr:MULTISPECIES: hypothetical protein [unclassified Pseudomonas]
MATKPKIAYLVANEKHDALQVVSTEYDYGDTQILDNIPEKMKMICPDQVKAGWWYQSWTGKFVPAEEFNQAPEKHGFNASKNEDSLGPWKLGKSV